MGMPPQAEFEIRVPASIANLGPGFDTLAVAVELYLSLRVRVANDASSSPCFQFVDCQLQGENYIDRAFQFLARQSHKQLPSLQVEVRTEIPMRSGLGSSAAATVAGIRLYDAVAGPLSPNQMLNAATALEGHPDNVAAALLGGMTSSCDLPDGSATAVQFRWPESLQLIVLTPEFGLSTASARQVLPPHVTRQDAVYNLQRIGLLLSALQTETFSLFREALHDRLHQPYRQSLVPGLEDLLGLEHPDLLGVCLSGAGPSIVGFAQQNVESVADLLRRIYLRTGNACQVRTMRVHQGYSAQTTPQFESATRSRR
jgi:homoserine kinase